MSEEAVPDEIPEELAQYQDEPETEPAPDPPEPPAEPEPEPEPDPITEKAMKAGWKPQDQYEGDPDEWVDAGEFVRRQPIFQRAKAAEKRAKDLEKKVEAVTKHALKIEERTRAKVLEELEAERRKAVEDGDVEAFAEADKKYQEAQKPEEPEQAEPEDEIPEEIKAFADRNSSWFEQNYAMTDEAVKATKFYRDKGKPLDEALKLAEVDIKRKYPEHFENPNKSKPSPVSPGSKEQRPAKRTYASLTAEQKTVYSALKGHMSLEEYIAELDKQGE